MIFYLCFKVLLTVPVDFIHTTLKDKTKQKQRVIYYKT